MKLKKVVFLKWAKNDGVGKGNPMVADSAGLLKPFEAWA